MAEICGIDEAGRGCIAGPLCVAGCVLHAQISGLNDSKKLSEKKREELFEKIVKNSNFKIVEFSSADVDEMGLSACLKTALEEIVAHFGKQNFDIIFDGNSKFGASGFRTMVGADAKIPEVSAASILAKVTRDRKMREIAKTCPQYGFAKNKGYGAKAHIEAIKKFGYTEFHRKSYRLKALEPTLFD